MIKPYKERLVLMVMGQRRKKEEREKEGRKVTKRGIMPMCLVSKKE